MQIPSPSTASKPKRRLWHKTILPLAVLLLAALGAFGLVQSATEPPRSAPQERVWSVSTMPVRIGAAQPRLRLYGRLVAGRAAELRALVAGEVVAVSEQLREGGLLLQGEELLRIDDFTYQSALREARANLAEARARLQEYRVSLSQEEESLRRELAQLELVLTDQQRAEELAERGTVSQKVVDDKRLATLAREVSAEARRNNVRIQQARIAQQEAVIERLESAVERARRNLRDTVLSAPFDGLAEGVGVAVGRLVNVNDQVANLIDLHNLEARFTLSNAQYGRIIRQGDLTGRELQVFWNAGRENLAWTATVARAAPRIAAGSGGVDIYVRLQIEDIDTPLRPGAFLEADFPDVAYENVARLPQSALYDGDIVYVVEDDRLQPRRVETAGEDGEFLLLRGELRAGDMALVSRLPQAGAGVRVRADAP